MARAESISQRRYRLRAAGKWVEFLRFRTLLEDEHGYSHADAGRIASMEFSQFGERMTTADQQAVNRAELTGLPAGTEVAERALEKARAAGETIAKGRRKAKAGSVERMDVRAAVSVKTGKAGRRVGVETDSAGPVEPRRKKRRTTLAQDVMWVYDVYSDLTLVQEDAISDGAWNYLSWVRDSKQNRDQFFGQILPKFAPTKGEQEHEARFKDDGSKQLSLIEQIEANGYLEPLLPAGAEGSTRESGMAKAAVAAV